MRSNLARRAARIVTVTIAALGIFLLQGCLEKRVVWSPDGTRAAVVTDAGLFFCDPAGALSPQLATDVYQLAWLGDSEHLVLARERRLDSWAALAAGVGSEHAAIMVRRADEVWTQLQAGALWSVVMLESSSENDGAALYLREHQAEGLRSLAGDSWNEIASLTVGLHELVSARLSGDHLEIGVRLYAGFERIDEIRPSPDSRTVAFVTDMEENDDYGFTYVVPGDGSRPPTRVAGRTAAYPDWTRDGRSLVYVQGSGDPAMPDELSLGTVVRRRVVNEAGSMEIAERGEDLAGLMFSVLTRVRCLTDGRILFNAAEVCVPMAAADAQASREQLFALDGARQATLVRLIPRKAADELPEVLAFFEVSPDESQLLFGGTDGEVCVFTLASAAVDVVQAKGEGLQGAPTWHPSGTISYLRRSVEENGQKPARKAELILRRQKEEAVLSHGWTDDIINSVVK